LEGSFFPHTTPGTLSSPCLDAATCRRGGPIGKGQACRADLDAAGGGREIEHDQDSGLPASACMHMHRREVDKELVPAPRHLSSTWMDHGWRSRSLHGSLSTSSLPARRCGLWRHASHAWNGGMAPHRPIL
jgi:hypothetical protein